MYKIILSANKQKLIKNVSQKLSAQNKVEITCMGELDPLLRGSRMSGFKSHYSSPRTFFKLYLSL